MSFGTYNPRFYPVGDDKYPSVTTILSVLDKPALLPWVAKSVVEYIRENVGELPRNVTWTELDNLLVDAKKHYRIVSKKACDIGTAVHGAVEYYLKGYAQAKAVELALQDVEEKEGADLTADFVSKVESGFSAFIGWSEEHKLHPVALEVAMYNHDFRYAGRVDFVGYVDSVLTLIDFKTSKGFYPEMAMQTSAYRDCVPETDAFKPGDIMANGVLRLDKETGQPHYKDYSETYEIDREMFQLLCQFYNKSLEKKKGKEA